MNIQPRIFAALILLLLVAVPNPSWAANSPPTSDPNGPYSGTVGIPLTFDGSGSSDPDGTLVAYDWEFGDGSTGTGVSPTHTYGTNGTFTVSLTVTDESGLTDTATTTATIGLGNQPPDCDSASPSTMLAWPANRKFVNVNVLGVTDPDGDPIAIEILSIYQDELVDQTGNDRFVPDGMGIGTSTAAVRAERSGGGNGRVYHIIFNASDFNGAECTGEVMVSVPANQSGAPAVDDGPFYDSTATP